MLSGTLPADLLAPPRATNWVEAVLYGALARGCNKPTFILLNLALLGCIGLLGSLLVHVEAELQLHFAVLLALAIGLLISVNWVVSQTGLVSSDEQHQELFGKPEPAESSLSSSDQKLD